MGLNSNTNNIAKEIETLNKCNQEQESAREMNARLERELEMAFTERFMSLGITVKYEFYNILVRNELIKNIGTNDLEYVKLNKMYDRVLNRVLKIFKQHEKYIDWCCNDIAENEKFKNFKK